MLSMAHQELVHMDFGTILQESGTGTKGTEKEHLDSRPRSAINGLMITLRMTKPF